MAKTFRQKIGQWGEDLALKYLLDLGYECLQRNYHCLYGEIDLIMLKDNVYYFVEVKTRRNDHFGLAEYSITKRKLNALLNSAEHFLSELKLLEAEWQVDLIVIEKFDPNKEAEIIHFEHIGIDDDED